MSKKAESAQPGSSGRQTTSSTVRSPLARTDLKLQIFEDEVALAYPPRTVERGKEYRGVITCWADFSDFYVRLDDAEGELLNSIDNSMNRLYGEGKTVSSLKARDLWTYSMPCAARYEKDGKWYRARLADVAYGAVRFVDYGNLQMCAEDHIKPLTRAMAEIAPPSVIRCSITDGQDSSQPSYSASACGQRVIFTVLNSSESYCEILMQHSSCDVESVSAVVTYVGQTSCSLYARETNKTIWAARAAFHDSISRSPKPLQELIQVGQPASIRAITADKLYDFKLSADLIAVSAHPVGTVFEDLGYMYLVSETYSVIVVDNAKGYVFLPNHIVEAGDISLDKWYGTRVWIRAVTNIPEEHNRRAGRAYRMKALSTRLIPGKTRGPFRHAGVYRRDASEGEQSPSSASENRKKTGAPGATYFTNLPEELLREFNSLGMNTVGIEKTQAIELSEQIRMIRENVLNQQLEESKATADHGLLGEMPALASTGDGDDSDDMPMLEMPLSPEAAVREPSRKPESGNEEPAAVKPVDEKVIDLLCGSVRIERRSIECQTDDQDSATICDEFGQLRSDAIEELRRAGDTDLETLATFVQSLDRNLQTTYFELRKNL